MKRLAETLSTFPTQLVRAKLCSADTLLEEALAMFEGSPQPLLVYRNVEKEQAIVGIVTPFDLL
jgi:hypothetical protein